MDLNSFRTDANLSKGKWIEYSEGTRFLIASAYDPSYKKALRQRVAKIPAHKLKNDPELAEKIAAEVMAEKILLSWEGVTDNGVVLQPTPEERRKAMQIPAFRDWVAEQANDLSNHQAEGEAAATEELKSGPGLADPVE